LGEVILGFELRALNLRERCLYHLNHTLALYALVILGIGPHVYAQAGLDLDPPIYASHIAGITERQHHAQLLLEMRSPLLFFFFLPKLDSNS
jgi:hypothetical protein